MKRVIPVLLALVMLLAACGGDKAPETTEASTAATTASTAATEKETKPKEDPASATVEVAEVYRHPLTGEILDKPFTGRVFAVSNGNSEAALPQYGLSHADIVHEILAEGGTTRLAVLYSNPDEVPAIGSIRSTRMYLLDIGRAYNAIYTHCGTSKFADSYISDHDIVHIDAMYHNEFYRDQDRLNAGYDWEHTMFVHGEDMVRLAAENGYDTEVPEGTTYGFNFTDEPVNLNGETANEITLYFTGDARGKVTTMKYDEATGNYHGFQWDQDLIDGNDNSVVQFKNVFILQVDTSVFSDGYHKKVDMHGDGDGWFACNGQIVPIQWHREGLEAPFTYTLADGTPLEQNPGHNYIGFIPTYGAIEYE